VALNAIRPCLRRSVLRRTLGIALIVGTILSAVNQGAVVIGGHASMLTWLRVAVNYLTPFLVSNAGVLAVGRDRNAKEGP